MIPLRLSCAGLLLLVACSAKVDLGSNQSDSGTGASPGGSSSGGASNAGTPSLGGSGGSSPIGTGGGVFPGGTGGGVFPGGTAGTGSMALGGAGGMGTGTTYGFIGGVTPTCGPDGEMITPLCTGIRAGMACSAGGLVCPSLRCGLADLGQRTCACDDVTMTWACSPCEFPAQLTLPSAAPACVEQVDGLACGIPGRLCMNAPGNEVCLCWPQDECVLVWDCDQPPTNSTVVSPE